MRKLFLILAIIFTVLGSVFAFLPLGTIALLPIGIALLFAILTFQKSDVNQKKIVKIIFIISIAALIVVVAKELFVKDEVEKDVQFEKEKVESKKEDKKELENLENDLE